jgi:hypothetical protein
MTRSAAITLQWADGKHTFRLGYGELRELQEKTDAGPNLVLNRLIAGAWMIDDIVEIIRLGLIGGGEPPLRALSLTDRYVKERPDWTLNSKLAFAIIAAALQGHEDEPVGKAEAEGEAGDESPTHPSREVSGGSPPSTETGSSSA